MDVYPVQSNVIFDGAGEPALDRAVGNGFMLAYHRALYSNGMLPNDSTVFKVVPKSGLTVEIKGGLALGGGWFRFELEPTELTLEMSPLASTKYLIVNRVSEAGRECEFVALKGKTLATDLVRTDSTYDIASAIVTVRQNATQINESDIEDLRLSTDFFGISIGNLQVDTTEIFNQYLAALAELGVITEEAITDMREQLAGQLVEFVDMQEVWGAWIGGAISDPANYFQRNFDNPAMYVGSTRWKTQVSSTVTHEEIRGGTLDTGPVAASRVITTRTNGADIEYTFHDLNNGVVISRFIEHFDKVSNKQNKNWVEMIL